ncbi:FxsA family protein [Sulfurovum sp. ST-21]|uniref:FxsA family protein n=1 Tax=Sulfurovum indicum TaxID=2779528 RepID=A0A7M1S292_9BACT|nr:FxsA family protein [Sulfurovum indicum]QOR61334.1 FxsA family protein [Sulfurovum indicum]
MLIVILIPYLFLEIYFSLKMLEIIGALWSTVWIIASIFAGVTLLKQSPYAVMGNMQSLQQGKLDLKRFQDANMAYFTGAILLILPGVVSDFMGIGALLYTVYLQFVAKITPERTNYHTHKGDDNVIDVEIVDEHIDRNDRIERE